MVTINVIFLLVSHLRLSQWEDDPAEGWHKPILLLLHFSSNSFSALLNTQVLIRHQAPSQTGWFTPFQSLTSVRRGMICGRVGPLTIETKNTNFYTYEPPWMNKENIFHFWTKNLQVDRFAPRCQPPLEKLFIFAKLISLSVWRLASIKLIPMYKWRKTKCSEC